MDKFVHASGEIWNGDCLELMNHIPAQSVDMILCDLPYGTTSCKWDSVIPFEPLWNHYLRIAKPNAAIVLTASQPFTSALVMSNIDNFKYCWIWKKNNPTGFANAKKQPLRTTEDIIIFYQLQPVYYPQGLRRVDKVIRNSKSIGGQTIQGDIIKNLRGNMRTPGNPYLQEFTNYPINILEITSERGLHPTQKPVALFEYLIRTYTNEGAVILDNCSGSGTTAIAAHRTGRRSLCIEKELEYYLASCGRMWGEQNA